VRECNNSLFISVFLLLIFIVDLEVSELVCVLSGGNNTEPVTKVVLLQVLLRQIFQVPKEKTTSFTNKVNTGHFLTLLDYFYQTYETKMFFMKNKWKFFSDNRTFLHILYKCFISNRKSKFAFKTAGFVK